MASPSRVEHPDGVTAETLRSAGLSAPQNRSPLREVDENEEQPRQRERDQPLIPPPHVGQYQERDPYYEQPNDRAGFYEREDQFEPRRRNAQRRMTLAFYFLGHDEFILVREISCPDPLAPLRMTLHLLLGHDEFILVEKISCPDSFSTICALEALCFLEGLYLCHIELSAHEIYDNSQEFLKDSHHICENLSYRTSNSGAQHSTILIVVRKRQSLDPPTT
nr:hypothetical protein Iba_chr01cCG3370 [Ipomoea batatas]